VLTRRTDHLHRLARALPNASASRSSSADGVGARARTATPARLDPQPGRALLSGHEHPDRPHYSDPFEAWSRGEAFPLCYSRERVEAVTERRIRLRPIGEPAEPEGVTSPLVV
jgi:hypothetical protein